MFQVIVNEIGMESMIFSLQEPSLQSMITNIFCNVQNSKKKLTATWNCCISDVSVTNICCCFRMGKHSMWYVYS